MSVVISMSDHQGGSDPLSAKAMLARKLSLQHQDAAMLLDAVAKKAEAGDSSELISRLRASSSAAIAARNSTRSLLGGTPGPLPAPQHLGRALVAPPASSSPLLSSLSRSSSGGNRGEARLSPFLTRSLLPQASMIEALAASAADGRFMFNTAPSSSAVTNTTPFLSSRVSTNRALVDAQLSDAVLAHARLLSSSTMSLDSRFSATSALLAQHKQSTLSTQPTKPKRREPVVLFMDCDEDSLSEYQCLIRKQMELFEATAEEAACSVQGRNKQVVEGQVGIRCRYCCKGNGKGGETPVKDRPKGCMYFPTKLDRIYQAAQNLSAFHLCEHCPSIPKDVRQKILVLKERKSPAGGGKRYWGESVRCQGVYEDGIGLRFSYSRSNSSPLTLKHFG